MDWIVWLIVLGLVLSWWIFKSLGSISPEKAREHLRAGAPVVDVRSEAEFASDHVRGAINVPLGELGEAFPRRFPDKDAVILVHCLSGGRSAIAQRRLQSMGYSQVFNLGSLGRARTIVEQTPR